MRTDIKKDRKDLYLPGRTDFTEVDVPAITYLAIDGHGDPNTSPAYAIAIQALYAGAYAIRSALKKRTGDDFVVGPLEDCGRVPMTPPSSPATRGSGTGP